MGTPEGNIIFVLYLNFKTRYYNILFFFRLYEYFKSLLLLLLFLLSYFFKIKIFESQNFIQLEYIYNWIVCYKIWILLSIFVIFFLFIYYIKNYNVTETLKYLYIFIYHRINFFINLYLFIYLFKMDLNIFFEYNFIIKLIFIIYYFIFWIYLFFKKKVLNYKLLHFLNFPFIPLIFWIFLFCINDLNFLKLKYYFIDFDLKYYETNIELNNEEEDFKKK